MRLRILTTALAAILVAAGLAGCRSNVGVAARVGGERITESDVNGYLTPTGMDSAAAAQAGSRGITAPRSIILQYLIQEKVFEQTLKHNNISVSAGELAGSHDNALGLLLQTQLTGAALDAALDKQLPSSGVDKSFRSVFLRVEELEYKLIRSKQLKQFSELVSLIKQAKISVWVAGRYGKWNPTQLGLDGKPVVPAYLSVQPTPGTQAQPAG